MTTPSACIFNVNYETTARDAFGRITKRTETVGSTTKAIRYEYDHAGRLSEVEINGILVDTYVYDDNGNRGTGTFWTNAAGQIVQGTFEYDAQDRLVSFTPPAVSGSSVLFDYTASGALKSKANSTFSYTFAYDARGSLRAANTPTGRIDYVLDGFGRRVGRKKHGVPEREWIYADGINPIAEINSSGLTRFVYATGRNVPDFMRDANGTLYRIVTDQLGSVRLVVNAATGAIAQELDYNAFGVVIKNTAPGFQPFAFAGGLYDLDTKLTRFGARDYDAEFGRWTKKDPILFGGGQDNLYQYAGSNPVANTDATGLATYMCSRIAELTGNQARDIANGYRHLWLWNSTTGSEAGIGPDPRGWKGWFGGLFGATMVTDHRGAHNEKSWKDVQCEEQADVDEECVENYIHQSSFGQSFGPWVPFANDCGSFAYQVAQKCHKNYSAWLMQSAYGM